MKILQEKCFTTFSVNEANISAAKAAWLAIALKQNNIEELQELAPRPLQGELATLNRLKDGAPEVYYYWLKIAQLD